MAWWDNEYWAPNGKIIREEEPLILWSQIGVIKWKTVVVAVLPQNFPQSAQPLIHRQSCLTTHTSLLDVQAQILIAHISQRRKNIISIPFTLQYNSKIIFLLLQTWMNYAL